MAKGQAMGLLISLVARLMLLPITIPLELLEHALRRQPRRNGSRPRKRTRNRAAVTAARARKPKEPVEPVTLEDLKRQFKEAPWGWLFAFVAMVGFNHGGWGIAVGVAMTLVLLVWGIRVFNAKQAAREKHATQEG